VSINIVNRRIIMTPALATGALGLQTNLAAFWEFESTSWIDSTGNISNLTGNGTPTPSVTAGKVGNAVQFVNANGQYLSHADVPGLEIAGIDFSMMYWINITTFGGGGVVVAKETSVFPAQGYDTGIEFVTGFEFFVRVLANGNSNKVDTTTGGISSGTWYMVVSTYQQSTSTVAISVNNSAFNTLVGTGTVSGDNATFFIGNNNTGTTPITDSLVDQVGFWKNRILSSSDVNLLWNGGNGLTYAQMA
jgi:hypothetical protein